MNVLLTARTAQQDSNQFKISTAQLRVYKNCTQLRRATSEKHPVQAHPAFPELV
jgi:hypothetical protein